VGRWVNLLDARAEKRKERLEELIQGLALADEVGALCCVDIAGSYNAERWDGPHPDNVSRRFFESAVENARRIIDTVKPKRAKFCYEMMPWAFPDSPDSAVRLVHAVSRTAFAIHLDPCNLINSPDRLYRNAELIGECFDKLAPWIVSCHAKDVAWGPDFPLHIREVLPGTGVLDYRVYLARLSALAQQPPLMLEHLKGPGEYDAARRFIQGML
jgi:sugar phosphate isomerase/epimerase